MKNKFGSRFLFPFCMSLLLISSIIQIFPDDVKVTRETSASSIIYQTDWSAPNDYVSKENIEFINGANDIKLLLSGPGLIVSDIYNGRIVMTDMNGSIWITYGTNGSSTGQFYKPFGIYYDNKTGNIYIADTSNHRIVKTKINGSGWTTLGTLGNGTGQFNTPIGIDYDSSTGYVYVADGYNNRIVKTMINGSGWTTYGTWGSSTGQFDSPSGLFYDSSTEFIYVTDFRNCRIIRTKMDGSGWTTYGSIGSGHGQFFQPADIYYDSDTEYVYVSDVHNFRIVKTKMDGTSWTTYGSQGSGKGQFLAPYGIFYDNKTDSVLVCDSGNYRIVKTQMDGSGWATYGTYGTSSKGKFNAPIGLSIFCHNYYPNGSLESREFFLGGQANLSTLKWMADTPSNTTVKFQLRTGTNLTDLNSKAFIGPNGINDTFYTLSESTIWSGHDGDTWVQYKVYLSTKDLTITPILKDVTITYNLLPECPILISPLNNTLINDSKPVFAWMFIDNDSLQQNGFQLQIDDNEDFNSVNYDSEELISNVSSFQPLTPITEGKLFWRVRTEDSDGDWGPYSKPWTLMIDSKVPSSALITPINNTFHNKLNTIFGTAYDKLGGTGLNKVEIAIKRLNDDYYWDGLNWINSECWLLATGKTMWWYDSSSVPWLSGTQYNVQSRATDNATNVEIPNLGNIFTYDDENVVFSDAKPSPDYKSPIEAVEVGITLLDNTSGVNASTIEYAISEDIGNTWNPWVPVAGFEDNMSINISLNLTFPNGTGNRIKWRASDLAGNGPTESSAYIVKVNTQLQIFIPRVRLLSPKDGATVPTTMVTLSWTLENKDLLGVSYDVYFDTVNPPNVTRATWIMNTNFLNDNLTDGETYYWTVVPRIGEDVGWCMSGVWSFTVNTSVPFPTVTLTHPKNGSIIPTSLPTLVWSVDYEGTERITFDLYLGSNKDPGREIMSYPKTYYLPETALDDNTTYYWKVIPVAGGIQGPESETWSFTIKKDYIPGFGLNLTLEPAVVELKAAEMTYIKAIVKNLGEFNDTISLSIQIPNDVNIGAIVNEPVSMDTAPEGIAVFNLTIITPHDIKEGEINLTVMAVSEIAPEYGLSIEENAVLKVIILGAEKSESDKASTEIWIIFVIIVILIIVVLFFILLIKRRKRTEQEPSTVETGTDKPITIPTQNKLNGETTTTPTLAEPSQDTAIPTPTLTSSETMNQTPAPKQIPQPTLTPQLPPAQTQEMKTKGEKSTLTSTLASPQPKLATPKQTEPPTETPNQLQARGKDEKIRDND